MNRLLLNDLLSWVESPSRTPLILRGARQVGKTHLVRQLGKHFDYFVEINFEKNPKLKKIFELNLDPIRIVRELSLVVNEKITPGKTLLFLDEVQIEPNIILALRYFYEEMNDLHVIAAGSLIDFAIEQVGIPVGRVSFLYMYPMSFIEFLAALGEINLALEIVQHKTDISLNEVIHDKALRLLGEYMAIGGMPQAVSYWIESKDIKSCALVLKNIKNTYQQDFSKYAKKHQIKYVDLIFNQIPKLICQQFKYSHLSTEHRKRELEPALLLLEKAGIIHQVYYTHGNGVPLGAQANKDKFKLIMLDVGLNQAILGFDLKDWYLEPNVALVNKGAISESFIGQEMLAYSDPFDKENLHYWQRNQRGSNAEIDYVVTRNQSVVPVEVKSGHGAKLQSIRLFLESHPSANYGIRFSIHNYSITEQLHSFPLYAVAGSLEHKERILNYLKKEI